MFKKIFTFFTAVLIALVMVMPVQAEFADMWAEVYTTDGTLNGDGTVKLTKITSGITFKVLAVDSDTAETLYEYNDSAMTSLTNPITTTNFESATVCNDMVAFKVDPTDSSNDRYVDLIVVNTAGGFTAFVENFDKYNHAIVIDQTPNIQHHGVIWFAPSDNTEVDTGIDFAYDTLIEHVQVEVVTVDATETIEVGLLSSGTAGDADGFVDAASVATAGYPLVTLTTSGALMDNATNFDPDGHVILSANEQSLTYTGTAGSDTAAGYIHYLITKMR
jgi:hypothetical protein